MKQSVYDPIKSGKRMTIAIFISGSGTNYREIAAKNPDHKYIVFTNRPDCGGVAIARKNNHKVIELSHIRYFENARKRYGVGKVPRNCPERVEYEEALCRLIEDYIGKEPDLICLAGYDQWISDWMVDKYYPRILNVHPGDTTKGYDGLHWIPTAKAILAGDEAIKSTLFFVDKGEDTGPVLMQSEPLCIKTIDGLGSGRKDFLLEGLHNIDSFVKKYHITTYEHFRREAEEELLEVMKLICEKLQDSLKKIGDWKIYPYAVHNLIARGRVQVDGKTVYIDDRKMPEYGYRTE